MATTDNINLIQTKTNVNPQVKAISDIIQKASYWAVGTLIIAGLLVGGIYAYLTFQGTSLRTQKDELVSQVTQDAKKEGLLLSIRQRIGVIDKVTANQKHIDKLFSVIDTVVPLGSLKSLTLDDSDKATFVAGVGSISDAVSMVDALLKQGENGTVSKTQLESFALSDISGFEISLSFVPTL